MPILDAVVTLFGGDGLSLFLMMFLYTSMVRSSYIIIVSGIGDDVPILGAVVMCYCFFDDFSIHEYG